MISICHAPVTSPLPIKPASGPSAKYLELPYRNRMILLAFADIVWLEGAGNYTYIHTRDNRRYLSSKTLKRLEPALIDPAFCRVHKSTIINMAYLSEINFGTAPHLYLKSTQQIAISRRRLPATRRQVKLYQRMTATRHQPVA
ncbi:MAG TPA: LytTR family DNA-binding domain-containing protein [Fibrella sp.]|jgi:two-component system LytT family response regulator